MRRILYTVFLGALAIITCILIYGSYIDHRAKVKILKAFPDEMFLFEVLNERGEIKEGEDLALIAVITSELSGAQLKYMQENTCGEQSIKCTRVALMTAVFFAQHNLSKYEELISKSLLFSKDYFSSVDNQCPISHELAKLKVALLKLREAELPQKDKAQQATNLLIKLEQGAGSDFSVTSTVCKSSLNRHILAYQLYLGMLAELYLHVGDTDAATFLLSYKRIEQFWAIASSKGQ